MDIAGLIANPVAYIRELAQVTDTAPDLGLNALLTEAFAARPDLIPAIPSVTRPADFQLHAPCTFLRLRASFNCPVFSEIIPLRLFHSGRWFTGLVPERWTEPLAVPPQLAGLVDRRGVAVSTLSTLTPWARELEPQKKLEFSQHFQISDPAAVPDFEFEGTLEVTVCLTFDLPDIHGAVYDFFGFFEESAPRGAPLVSSDQGFYSHLPSFLCFAALPVSLLFAPEFPAVPAAGELRAHLLAFLEGVLEPLQAELLLLWLVGRARSSGLTGLAAGFLVLNLYGCTPAAAAAVLRLLSFLCASVVALPFSCARRSRTASSARRCCPPRRARAWSSTRRGWRTGSSRRSASRTSSSSRRSSSRSRTSSPSRRSHTASRRTSPGSCCPRRAPC